MGGIRKLWLTLTLLAVCLVLNPAQARERPRPASLPTAARPAKKKTLKGKKSKLTRRDLEVIRNMRLLQNLWLLELLDLFTTVRKK